MHGIKEIGSYGNPEEVGYTEWIVTRAGVYFVEEATGNIVGPYAQRGLPVEPKIEFVE